MSMLNKLAGAVIASALLAAPALAVNGETVTFAQFTQQDTDKVAQYRNTGSGNTLNITNAPAFFVTTAFGIPGVYDTMMTASASSNQMATSIGQQFQQNGWNGSISFGNGGTNYLTASFIDATFSFDGNGGSASLISTDPTSSITYTSNFLSLPDFDFKNFSLAFSGLSPLFTVAADGYGSDFDANIAGSFAGAADGPGPAGVIPEPATWAMLVLGFGLTGATMRRRNGRRVVAS